MNENENLVPKRRFKEFTNTGTWEQRKLVEELSLLKDGTHGTHIDTENGPYLLSAKNIKNGRVNITPADRKISIEEFNKIHTNFSLQAGDVLLTIVGSIGETAVLNNADNITFQRSVAYLRPKSMNSQFLYTTISGPLFQKELKNRQVVSAQPGIYLGDLAKIDITIPDIVEQTAIASFFKQLDDTIALHQRKLEKSKALKSAYLSEMFPAEGERKPKRRFAGFTDDWEQCKVRELFTVTRGQVLAATKTKDKETDEFIYPVYSSQTKNNGLMGFYNQYLFENAITWTTDGANAGTVNFRKGKFYSTNVNGVLLSDKGYANKAISEIINKIAWKHVSKVGNPKLMNNIMSEITIMIPSIEELNKISIP